MSHDQPDFSIPTLGPISKESRNEWRSTLSNDNNITDGTAPPNWIDFADYRGKFFPRGCRGKIQSFAIYCSRVAATTFKLCFSPSPGLAAIGSVVITPIAAWQWRSAVWNRFWDYDSLFIWTEEVTANARFAYDTQRPYDGHVGNPANWTWIREDRRYFIRVVYDAETAGDVPVSGTVNVIEIPSTATQQESAAVNVPNNAWTPIFTIRGAGTLIQAKAKYNTVVAPGIAVAYAIRLYADEQLSYYVDNMELTQSQVATFGRSSEGEFFQTNFETVLNLRVPIKFKHALELRAYQSSGAPVNVVGRLETNLMR